MPEVSVIVPNYNHAEFLVQRIESILAQTFTDFELILLDDCSTDESVAVLNRYKTHPRVSQIILNEKNSGSTFRQWKKGLVAAAGKYIWIAESDDYCTPDFLGKAVEALDKGADLFYCKTVRVWRDGSLTGHQMRWYEDISALRWLSDYENNAVDEVKDILFLKNTINNASAVVFRNRPGLTEMVDSVGSFRYCGDWMFWMLYLQRSSRIVYSTAPVNYFRTHGKVTRADDASKRNPELLRILRYILASPLSRGHRDKIVSYFFRTHLALAPKRSIAGNLPLIRRSLSISPRFLACWWKFYTKGK